MHLFICGEDHGLKLEIEREIKIRNLNKNYYFKTHMELKYQFLKMLDVFCLPSENENFGNVYLESLRVGTPIIASNDSLG